MKKIFAILLCALILCTMPVVAFAEGDSEPQDAIVADGEVVDTEPKETVSEKIVGWLQDNSIDISIVATVLLSIFYERIKHRKLTGSIGTLNNNAITVAENSVAVVQNALEKVNAVADKVAAFEEKIDSLIESVTKSDAEKTELTKALVRVESYINTAKIATLDLGNLIDDLLLLANIPTAKKSELHSAHLEHMKRLDEAAKEVTANVGEKA